VQPCGTVFNFDLVLFPAKSQVFSTWQLPALGGQSAYVIRESCPAPLSFGISQWGLHHHRAHLFAEEFDLETHLLSIRNKPEPSVLILKESGS
jgi:hypothetical protein